jgi:hypothetical protein
MLVPDTLGLLITENLIMAYVFNFVIAVFSPCWIGAAASTVNDPSVLYNVHRLILARRDTFWRRDV